MCPHPSVFEVCPGTAIGRAMCEWMRSSIHLEWSMLRQNGGNMILGGGAGLGTFEMVLAMLRNKLGFILVFYEKPEFTL